MNENLRDAGDEKKSRGRWGSKRANTAITRDGD